MTQLLIRNLEPKLVNQLKNMAKLHHRSLQDEIKFILEKVATIPADKLSALLKGSANTRWPKDFFQTVVGGWQGDTLKRAPQDFYEKRDDFS